MTVEVMESPRGWRLAREFDAGGRLVVNNPSRSVRRLLSLTELSGLFGVDGTS